MIQQTSVRVRQAGPEVWGQWSGRKSVVSFWASPLLITSQQDITPLKLSSNLSVPECAVLAIRFFLFSFFILQILDISLNTQDRRPLAPAAVAKMVVRREDDSIVDIE